MCKFCDNLKKEKKMELYYRTCSSLDNFCEYVNETNCSLCDECITKFVINPISGKSEDMYINIQFKDKATNSKGEDVIIDKCSESFKITYCPMCGEKISKEEDNDLDKLMYPFETVRH